MTDQDTREKLEDDVHEYANPSNGVGTLGAYWERQMLEFLDRQAAITRREYGGVDWLAQVESLQDERDELQAKLEEMEDAYNQLHGQLKNERNNFKQATNARALWQERYEEAQVKLDAYDETHIALPVDADGDVLRIGDELKCLDESVLLNSLSWDGRRWYATETVISSGWYPAHTCRHVKPRTVEDVLRDLVNHFSPNAEWTQLDNDAVAEYADELRELMGGDTE